MTAVKLAVLVVLQYYCGISPAAPAVLHIRTKITPVLFIWAAIIVIFFNHLIKYLYVCVFCFLA